MSGPSTSAVDLRSEWRCFGGRQLVVEHDSAACGVPMTFALFLPPGVARPPLVTYLSGLTCTWENAATKAGLQRVAAELGLAVLFPDTSPRGDAVPDAEGRWDLGKGAGFYVDATREPWARHYRMYSYVTDELPRLLGAHFELDLERQGITGHSMGGHGALVLGLREPARYRSISAFAPIVAPAQVPWGRDAFATYLADEKQWADYDATRLVASHARPDVEILIDQGAADNFLDAQLRPTLFEQACAEAGQPVRVRLQDGYDHSYYFVATFAEDHLRHHAAALA